MKASDIEIRRRQSDPLLVFSKELHTYYQAANYRKETSQNWELHQAPHAQHAFWDTIGTRWIISCRKAINMNLEERQISKQIHSSLS